MKSSLHSHYSATANSEDSTPFNSSASKLVFRQASVSKLDSSLHDWTLDYNHFARTTHHAENTACLIRTRLSAHRTGWSSGRLLSRRIWYARISAKTPTLLSEGFHGFPQYLQDNSGIAPRLGSAHFLPTTFKFIIRQPIYNSTLYNHRY
jgi:hypothetical protein